MYLIKLQRFTIFEYMNTQSRLFSNHILLFLSLLVLGACMVSCSQENNSFVARNYHNLLARDNSFFLARERMKLVEVKVYDFKEDNYNGILHPLPPIDTNKTKGLVSQLDDIIKKASMPIRRHKNSDYVDDSYILVGRCRIYRGEFKMGIETYKYVNAHGKDDNDKIESLIYLVRAYMAANQLDNAKTVLDHLDKQTLTQKNKAIYNTTKAEYLRIFERYDEMIPLLEEAAPLQKKRDQRSRMYFILGQLYQQSGNDTLAYKNYHKVVKSNPPYEMLFVARLNLYQVTNIANANTTKKLNKYYTKLLKDPKNEEYRDKIYYEMAMFEYKQKNLQKAIEYLKLSSLKGRSGGYQKGFTYLKLAEIYYDDLEDYENAAAYYDSTAATFSKKDKRYPVISKRERILDEFVKHINTIKRQDSLLKVSYMDSTALNTLIDSLVAKEQEAYRLQQLALKKKKQSGDVDDALKPNASFTNGTPLAASWYFSNATAVQNGISEFTQKFGKRKLEDHWRRSKKDPIVDYDIPDSDSLKATNDSLKTLADDGVLEKEKNDITPLKVDRKKYLVDIPFTDSQRVVANGKIEEAMFQVASIYNHKLDEPQRAIRTYENILKRYPESTYVPEVLYNLYLIYKEQNNPKQEIYKARLLSEHPNSIFAKLIRNPNYYRDSKIANKFATVEYKDVYALYKANRFAEADSAGTVLSNKYPDSDILDKIAYIQILCRIKIEGTGHDVQQAISNFPEKFPESALLPAVKELSGRVKKDREKYITPPADVDITIPEDKTKDPTQDAVDPAIPTKP